MPPLSFLYRCMRQSMPTVLHIQILILGLCNLGRNIHTMQTSRVRDPYRTGHWMGNKSFHNLFHHNCQSIVGQRPGMPSKNLFRGDCLCIARQFDHRTYCCTNWYNRNIMICLMLKHLVSMSLFVRQLVPALRLSWRNCHSYNMRIQNQNSLVLFRRLWIVGHSKYPTKPCSDNLSKRFLHRHSICPMRVLQIF